jgi:RNA polymerase sigma factor (sigma-70 family)
VEPGGTEPDDAARLKRLFDEHAGRLYAYCLRRGDRADAEEIVAETFLVAWRRIDQVPAEPLPWLFRVAGNTIANRRRGDRRRADFMNTMRAVEGSRSRLADPADEVATRFSVLQILDRLPPAEREALMLTAWDGLDVREGAIAAGCSRATFSVRLHRARRRVMKELEATRHSYGEAPTAEHVEIRDAKEVG